MPGIIGPGAGKAPGQQSKPPYSTAMDVPLPKKTFANRQQAVAFLRANPDFVLARFGNLSKGSRKLLADAGYKVTVKFDDGKPRYDLHHGGKVIHSYSGELPKPDGKQYINILKPKTGAKDKPTGGKQPSAPAGPVVMAPPAAPVYSSGIDIAQLAQAAGVDPRVFAGLRPDVGNLIPLRNAQRGARPMGPGDIDALVQSMVGDQFQRQIDLNSQERARTEAQNAHNIEQIRHWYDQVMQSQGVAAQRDAAFGDAAVASTKDSTRAIISALGGEANMGSGMVAAAGAENVGNLEAISTIQDQYNADMAPLLRGEGAGAMVREQALGADRLKDLSMRLQELQSSRGSAEAEMRFNVWQANNDILDRRLQNELAIRQANTALRQQRFQNQMGVRQAVIAAQAANAGSVMDAAQFAQGEAKIAQGAADKAADRQFRAQLEAAKEAGRNYRATLPSGSSKPKSYANSTSSAKDSAWNDIVDALDGRQLSKQQAVRLAAAVIGGYGWTPKNVAVQTLMRDALREAGYDV